MNIAICAILAVVVVVVWRLFGRYRDISLRLEGGRRIVFVVARHWKLRHEPFAPFSLINARDGACLQANVLPFQADLDQVRAIVSELARNDEPMSVERQLTIYRIQSGSPLEGYYYFSTDRNVQPGAWAFKASGCGIIAGHVLAFTILTHVAYPKGMAEAFEVLLNARPTS